MHFKRFIIARLTFIFLGFVSTTASNVKRSSNIIVPATAAVNVAALRYTNELIGRQQALKSNFRAEFTEILRGANEVLITLRNKTDVINNGLLGEATAQEAKEVVPIRQNYTKMMQKAAQLWMIDDRMIADTSRGSNGGGVSIRQIIQSLQEQKNASEIFGRVVVSKMPTLLQGSLKTLDNTAHLALRKAIGLWESRQEKCRSTPTDALCYGSLR